MSENTPVLEQAMQQLEDCTRILAMNPGKTFAKPDGWLGNRAFYQGGEVAAAARGDTAYLMPPDGMSVIGDRTLSVVTDEPTGPLETRITVRFWELPAVQAVAEGDPAGTKHVIIEDSKLVDRIERPGDASAPVSPPEPVVPAVVVAPAVVAAPTIVVTPSTTTDTPSAAVTVVTHPDAAPEHVSWLHAKLEQVVAEFHHLFGGHV